MAWGRIAAGLGAAASWGALVEALAWALLRGEPLARITRGARLAQIAEVALFAAAVALLAVLGCAAIPALRRRLAAAPVWIPSALGLAASLALGIAFLGPQPPLEQVRLSQDPMLLRALPFALALAAALGVSVAAFALPAPGARLLPIQLAVVALALAGGLAPSAGVPREGRADVFLISIDTLRADHLGCYGYDRATSPALDAFCRDAVVYESAMAAASATIPSYTSLMSGTLQGTHGVFTNYDKAGGEIVTLAERLRDAGYRTAALLEGTFPGSFANVGQGFERLVQRGITAATPVFTPSEGLRSLLRGAISFVGEALAADLSVTTWATLSWLRALPPDVPVFAHVYWPYPHDPYTPPAHYLKEIAPRDELSGETRDVVHRYDAEILYTDVQVGRVLDALREAGRYDDAWILFTSDHGEELGRVLDEGEGPAPFFGHSRHLFDTSVRVPLVVKPPRGLGVAPRRDDAVVSTASVPATLLAALGIESAETLVAPLPGLVAPGGAAGIAFSLARNPSRSFDRASVRQGPWRLIETRSPAPGLELLRYGVDGESRDLRAAEPERADDLLRLLHAQHPADGAPDGGGAEELSDRERRMLEELGYVE